MTLSIGTNDMDYGTQQCIPVPSALSSVYAGQHLTRVLPGSFFHDTISLYQKFNEILKTINDTMFANLFVNKEDSPYSQIEKFQNPQNRCLSYLILSYILSISSRKKERKSVIFGVDICRYYGTRCYTNSLTTCSQLNSIQIQCVEFLI